MGSRVTALTTEMRRALHRMRQARPEFGARIGPAADEVPAGTAKALERRGLARVEGYHVHLTDDGRVAADDVHAAQQRILHGDASGRSPT